MCSMQKWRSEPPCRGCVSPSTLWVTDVKLRPLVLAVGTFLLRVNSLAPHSYCENVCPRNEAAFHHTVPLSL